MDRVSRTFGVMMLDTGLFQVLLKHSLLCCPSLLFAEPAGRP